MWHEARKQEKKIRCMLVDYQRRAQRRKDYYDRIRADPTQFLQLHGRPYKIHLDQSVCIAANSAATMMSWPGNPEIKIDRFDVRAHLDFIPDTPAKKNISDDISYEDRQINYERYRILVQNDFFGISETKFLHQINLEEKFGLVAKNVDESQNKRKTGAAISFNYDDSTTNEENSNSLSISTGTKPTNRNDEDDDSESDIDLDLTVDVSKIETQQANELNTCAHSYGMVTNDFFSFLNNDLEEAESIRLAKEQEEEKAMFSGRKSRKERRAFRDRILIGRKFSPPSYASKKRSPSADVIKSLVSSTRSKSKSLSPNIPTKITYITSFGGIGGAAAEENISLSRGSNFKEKDRVRRRRSRSSSADRKKKVKIFEQRSSPLSKVIDSAEKKPSPKIDANNSNSVISEPVVFQRYYGRNRDKNSSESSLSSEDSFKDPSSSKLYRSVSIPNISSNNKRISDTKLTPQEILKKKRQVLLNKQYKADKRAEREKVLKQAQERQDRAEEMKEISTKMRRRQRMSRGDDNRSIRSSKSTDSSTHSDRLSKSRSRSTSRSACGHGRRDRRRSSSSETSKRKDRNCKRGTSSSSSNRSRSRSFIRSRSRSGSSNCRKRYANYSRKSYRDYDKDSSRRSKSGSRKDIKSDSRRKYSYCRSTSTEKYTSRHKR